MRNLRPLATPGEVRAHVAGIWRTDMFRAEAGREGGLLHGLLGRFAAAPRAFADLSEPRIEAAHFSAWFGVVCHRDWYGNPFVSDLYCLHEIAHAATFDYDPIGDWDAWRRRMVENEFEVSLLTEAIVYLEMPGLRERSFEGPIWADRFLGEADRAAYAGDGRGALVARVTEWRRRAMAGEFPGDPAAETLATYAAQNVVWAEVWRASWREIERHMASLPGTLAASGPAAASAAHVAWLEARSDGGVPFRREAEAFAETYHRNKAKAAG